MTIKWVRTRYCRYESSLVPRPRKGRGKSGWYLMFAHAPKLPRKLVLSYTQQPMLWCLFFCCLCCATLEKAAERRNLFSESSQSVVPLLLKTVTCIYGKDVLREVFKSDCKVYRPCVRLLNRMTKLDKELQEKQVN